MYSGQSVTERGLRARTVDLNDIVQVPGHVFELVDQPLAVHFVEDAALVVVPGEQGREPS